MSRLQTQWQRLYVPTPLAGNPPEGIQGTDLVNAEGLVRAMVLELARPADWPVMAKLWRGVQDELHLPAPGIAVNGVDGYQLWFSVSQAITVAQAQSFLGKLCARFWADIPGERVLLMPAAQHGTPSPWRHADPVPAPTRTAGQWSAFVTRDLAPVFNDSPWLDIPPNPEGQADLLTSLRSIERTDLLAMLNTSANAQPSMARANTSAGERQQVPQQDPRQFLLGVMNDPTVDLALRIEAAKALLPPARGQ